MTKLRIVLADDHPLVLMGLGDLIKQDVHLTLTATASSSTELVAELTKSLPDIVIVDYHMPDPQYGDGIKFIGYLLRQFEGLKVIVLTMLSNPMLVKALYKAGVKGVVFKQDDPSEVFKAIRLVSLGNTYTPPSFLETNVSLQHQMLQERFKSLTPREFEVLRYYVRGGSLAEIAERLNRSIKTVSSQKMTAMRKLEAKSNQELMAFCLNSGVFHQ
ncbi:response regulator transcription factor [Comamonas sp. C11]|uniref:response regulator transcription factor n=1 Tax=Comamonas sp. C11 TaxID=2966554 RepID=UPI0021125054|nr:response regulator transcription factor [Comamonas sp. C11]UUC91477.1 response regulator transcription factor [Comamonas sp. C11]